MYKTFDSGPKETRILWYLTYVMYELFTLIISFPAANFTVTVNIWYVAPKSLMIVENKLERM